MDSYEARLRKLYYSSKGNEKSLREIDNGTSLCYNTHAGNLRFDGFHI